MKREDAARILIVAGEASGDLYGSRLVRAIRETDPEIHYEGIGGEHLRKEGVDLFADSRDLAVVGLVEVLSHWKPIQAAFERCSATLRGNPPDLLVLIDYPDFNLRLAAVAKDRGIPVIYFISPQVWAWRKSRVGTIARTVEKMLVILPFEEAIYREAGVSVEFVGHPLLDILPEPMQPETARRRVGLDPTRPVLGLLPGSRRREIASHLPVMLESASRLLRERSDLQLAIPLASTLEASDLEPYLARAPDLPPVHLLRGSTGDALGAMDAAVIKSGTATLEAALMGLPMVVVYRTNPLTFALASLLADVPHVGLVNIVAGRRLVAELVQGSFRADGVARELRALLDDPVRARSLRSELIELRAKLGTPGCFRRAAASIVEALRRSPRASSLREKIHG